MPACCTCSFASLPACCRVCAAHCASMLSPAHLAVVAARCSGDADEGVAGNGPNRPAAIRFRVSAQPSVSFSVTISTSFAVYVIVSLYDSLDCCLFLSFCRPSPTRHAHLLVHMQAFERASAHALQPHCLPVTISPVRCCIPTPAPSFLLTRRICTRDQCAPLLLQLLPGQLFSLLTWTPLPDPLFFF